MLGYNHGMLGVAAFGACTWYAEHVVHLPALRTGDLAMGVVVAAGAALAPDLDEHESLAGRANPTSDLPIFGGHRTRTHTLMTAALVVLATLACERDRTATAALVGFFARTGGSVLFATARHWGHWCRCPSPCWPVPELPLPERGLVASRGGRLAVPEPPAGRLADPRRGAFADAVHKAEVHARPNEDRAFTGTFGVYSPDLHGGRRGMLGGLPADPARAYPYGDDAGSVAVAAFAYRTVAEQASPVGLPRCAFTRVKRRRTKLGYQGLFPGRHRARRGPIVPRPPNNPPEFVANLAKGAFCRPAPATAWAIGEGVVHEVAGRGRYLQRRGAGFGARS